eukprot:CAMPEP_0203962928 /NCGR_PEP_ID=MMETSP0359-20131031/93004_1 /ASSEMBLY_ACC=CAM_ASM_000338 /TAXON_ID=268821 /ORGANISM="Scrippsiella Hangoei, Strain SHTV-5" /LENGTH=33 /DNA_ID= /DNA_START= /DNA_END= /DNA_ORIENTATION=
MVRRSLAKEFARLFFAGRQMLVQPLYSAPVRHH